MKGYITVVTAILLVGSCGNGKKNGVEEEWTQDSLLLKRVFLNDIVQSEIRYQKNGRIKEGRALYYENGQLGKSVYYKQDKLVGSHVEYYANGMPSLFICHDSYGDTVFLRTYDTSGTVLLEEGEIRPHGFISDQDLKDKHVVKQHSFVVMPPKGSVDVRSYFLYHGSKDTLYPVSSRVTYGWIFTYLFRVPEPGIYHHRQVTVIRDSLKGKIYHVTDSSTKEFFW